MGKYSIGTFIGEEWIYYKNYMEREDTCVAREPCCVLEMTTDAYDAISDALYSANLNKDISMLET